MRSRTDATGFTVHELAPDEALGHGHRIRQIYRDAILVAGPRAYDAAQVAAWARSVDDLERWDRWMRDGATWVVAPDDALHHLVGFAMVRPADHIHQLYVDPEFQGRHVASALLTAVETEARRTAIPALTTHASLLAHPVFRRRGYVTVEWQTAEASGQVFRRATMRKVLR